MATSRGRVFPLALAGREADRARRWQGRWLEVAGFGPKETPSRAVDVAPGVRLRSYGGGERPGAATLLLVPAPIKRAYIWDLRPPVSVVRRCLEAGHAVYLAEWREPGPGQQDWGLACYADRFLEACLDAIAAEQDRTQPFLLGHSLGGTLAALFASLRPDRVTGLLLIEAPLKFGPDAGAFVPLLASAPPAGALAAALGGAPGVLLTAVSGAAAPEEFLWWRWRDAVRSLGDLEAATTHLTVMRWTLDEFAQPARLFTEVVEELYRGDRFALGTLKLAGRPALPARLAGLPIAAVVEPDGRLVTPASALAPLPAFERFDYTGEVGVALKHLGALVGRRAHAELWPRLLAWLERHAPAVP
ncbi:MAG TPA: alpha/beta fold hydrolase [Geminicoccaceae bacterium]|nr:alpha/beta fold hydrolase [Geminicoccaceae bacterium]